MAKASDKRWCVFLLGAGFSFAHDRDLPLMSDFVCRARAYFDEHTREANNATLHISHQAYHAEFRDYYQKVLNFHEGLTHSIAPPMKSDWKNLEVLFTQADFQLTIGAPGATELCDAFAWVVWDMYARLSDAKAPEFSKLMKAVIQGDLPDLFPAIVTTNYDLYPEWSLWRDKELRPYTPGFQYYDSADRHHVMTENNAGVWPQWSDEKDGKPSQSQIPIIKLHGSANWFELRDSNQTWIAGSRFPARPECSSVPPEIFDRFAIYSFRRGVQASLACEIAAPAIIPPLLGKGAVHSVIKKQWAATVQIVRSAAHLIIIGYSFPDADVFMTRLLTEGFYGNSGLPQITIVNKKIEAIRLK